MLLTKAHLANSSNLSCADPRRREKINLFFFTLLYGASKDFMNALKAFRKPFKASQRKTFIKPF